MIETIDGDALGESIHVILEAVNLTLANIIIMSDFNTVDTFSESFIFIHFVHNIKSDVANVRTNQIKKAQHVDINLSSISIPWFVLYVTFLQSFCRISRD